VAPVAAESATPHRREGKSGAGRLAAVVVEQEVGRVMGREVGQGLDVLVGEGLLAAVGGDPGVENGRRVR
jgi:hypothetical protein